MQDVWLTETSGGFPPSDAAFWGEVTLLPYDLPLLLAPPCAHKASKTRPGDMGS